MMFQVRLYDGVLTHTKERADEKAERVDRVRVIADFSGIRTHFARSGCKYFSDWPEYGAFTSKLCLTDHVHLRM